MKKTVISVIIILLCCSVSLEAQKKKALYIIVDGVPADCLERLHPKTIFDIADKGGYSRACTGGEIGDYSETATISAIGYTNVLTGTWMNKHNVVGNENQNPNYNYWSVFRVAKEQKKPVTTGLFSSWADNRTTLIGAGKPETGNLKIDYVFDGYESQAERFPTKENELRIFDIDSVVTSDAAKCIREDAPDLSWVYLWYTDDAFHIFGNGAFSDKYVNKTDDLLAKVWEAVKYRESKFNEDWLVIVTTDHGRDNSGHNHGGQSFRERGSWIATNKKKVNDRFGSSSLALIDIMPTICAYMGFELPSDVRYEIDGLPFIGKADISNLRALPYDKKVILSWDCEKTNAEANVYMAVSNNYKTGGKDEWTKVGSVPAKNKKFVIDLSACAPSGFYKFVVETPDNTINRWLIE